MLVYALSMVFAYLALAAIASTPVAPTPARASATATIRILQGARVHLGPSSEARMIRASVRIEDGQRRPAYLIEFQ